MFRKINSNVILLIILLISLCFRIYKLNELYNFDWDQEDDAQKVTEMITSHKPRLIGPRVANDNGFFVGPFHYYFLVPFYLITNNNPIAGAYASISIGLITTLVIYVVSQKIFGENTARLSALIYSLLPSITSWNVMYTAPLSLIIFYLCHQLISGKNNLFPLLIFTYSFSATTHLVPVSLFIPIIISLLLADKKPSSKQIILSLILSIIPLIPLIIFDLRHQFLNIKNLINFISVSKNNDYPPYLFLRSYWRSINLLFIKIHYLIIVERIVIITAALTSVFLQNNKKYKIFIFSWLLTPILILSFYRGNIPEYYYGSSNIIIPILLSFLISKILSAKLLTFFSVAFLTFQIINFPSTPTGITLKDKTEAVSFLINQNRDPIFNVSYDLPLGFDNGYAYLFRYFGKEPQNTPAGHLYSISLSTRPSTGEIVYTNNTLSIVRK
ncbi:MAG: glycosyltransferase family 39 protein [Candidatus Shapirobacteria bacterium]|jgi:4-amino-4-deoxy-L-arabinose transferase-like glycosyltransferase